MKNTLIIVIVLIISISCNQSSSNIEEITKKNDTIIEKKDSLDNKTTNEINNQFPINITCNEKQLKRIDWNDNLPKELERHIIYFLQQRPYGLLVFYEYSANPDFDDELVYSNVMYAATYNLKNELIASQQLIDADCDMVNAGNDGSETKRSSQKIMIKSLNEFAMYKKIEKLLEKNKTETLLNEETNYEINAEGLIILKKENHVEL